MIDFNDFLSAPTVETVNFPIDLPKSYRCFMGAWYYKVVTTKAPYLGMQATITLPTFTPDPNRFEMVEDKYLGKEIKKYLDTPSIYLGGSSDFETDIGFGWFYGKVDGKISDEKMTFRPFWRSIWKEDGREVNEYKGTSIDEQEYYFFPGDRIRVYLYSPRIDFLQLRIELLDPTTNEFYAKIRKKQEANHIFTKNFISPLIPAPGNGVRLSEYKRVNAIDQYHNEGKPTQATNAKVDACIWEDVYLFLQENKKIVKVAMDDSNSFIMQCPKEEAFLVDKVENKERITIHPSRVKA